MRYPNLNLSPEAIAKLDELEAQTSKIYNSLLVPRGTGKFYISVYGNIVGDFLTEDDAEFYGIRIYGEEFAVYDS